MVTNGDPMQKDERRSPNPSVFWTQFFPHGAFNAVALQYMLLNRILVPFMMFRLHSGGCLTNKFSTTTSETFQKTNGIGLPGCVSPFSASYQAFPLPWMPPVP